MRRKPRLIAILLILSLIFVLAGCRSKVPEQPKAEQPQAEKPQAEAKFDQELILGGGSATGNSKIIVTAIAKVITDNVPGVRATGAVCPGFDAESVLLTHKKVMHGGVGTPIILENATKGIEPFPKEGVKLSLWFYHNEIPLNTLALADKGITKISELKGRKVGLAPPGTSNYIFAEEVLKAHGLAIKDIKPEYMDTSATINALKDGHIDAMLHIRDYSGAILELCTARDIVLLQPTTEAIPKVVERYPWAEPVKWPFIGNYPNMKVPEPQLCFSQPECMYLSSDLPDDLVYEMTKAVFEHIDVIQRSSKVFEDVKLETALAKVPIPPHPGALRYYKEMNVPGWEKYADLLK